MNFSTNQVIQLYVLETGATLGSNIAPSGAVQYAITHADGKIETTDVIKNVIGTAAVVAAGDDTKKLKELTITVKNGKVIAGQEYIIGLTFRGFGQEDVITKVIAAKAKSTTDTDLYRALAINAWLQRGVEVEPLFDIYVDGSKVTSKATLEDASTDFSAGFKLVEATPAWELGSFPETTATIEVGTTPIIVSGAEDNDWLVTKQFAEGNTTLPNTHKIADLELFAKGERGNSNALAGWPDNIKPDLYVNASDATGYAVLAVHYAFVGGNDEVQKSERDAIFVTPEASKATLTTIATAVNALPKIA